MGTNQKTLVNRSSALAIGSLLAVLLCCGNAQAQSTEIDSNSAGKASLILEIKRPPETPNPVSILRDAKLIYVKSTSLLVGAAVIEGKLRNRPEFEQLGLLITRDYETADLILEVK